jgi:hypothetical protein
MVGARSCSSSPDRISVLIGSTIVREEEVDE